MSQICKRCGTSVDRGGFYVVGYCEACHPRLRRYRARSCPACLAWGVFRTTACTACTAYRQTHPEVTACGTCDRVLPTRDGHCRLCWTQARRLAPDAFADPRQWFGRLAETGQQLAFAGMKRNLQVAHPRWRYRRSRGRPEGPDKARPPVRPPSTVAWAQQRLLDVRRDFTRFVKTRDADLANPTLIMGRAIAGRFAELRGWSHEVRRHTDAGLVVVLSDHRTGDTIRYSEVLPLAADRKVNAERVCEVLDALGILINDRPDRFELWLTSRTANLAPELQADVRAWLRTLRTGGPRRRPRSRGLTWSYYNAIRVPLADWSRRYGNLRSVTADDITTVLDALDGRRRHETHGALRSLFRYARRNRRIFRDPTVGIVVGKRAWRVVQPLDRGAYDTAIAAAVTPEARLMLALTVVHAARRPAMQQLTLDDLDLPNQRITIGGHTRPLDDLTRRALRDYLDHRNQRWPHSANRHLFISQSTCHETGPVSDWWCYERFRGLGVTLEDIRIDRTLEEATTAGGDPRHLAAVFGISEIAAIRYAASARALLERDLDVPAPLPRSRSDEPDL